MESSVVKGVPLHLQVRQYLIGQVAKTGDKPVKILTERQLGEKFSVSRQTVRNAIKELVAEKFLIVRSRQGTFTNPDKYECSDYHIGVLYGTGAFMSYEPKPALIFSGIINTLSPVGCSFDVLTFNEDGNSIDKAIECQELDGLIWISPKKRVFPAFKRLVNKGFPIVGADAYPNVRMTDKPENHVLVDLETDGITLADYFINRNLLKIVYCGIPKVSYCSFIKRLRERGIEFDESYLISDIDCTTEQLTELLRTRQVDAVYSNGGSDRFINVFTALERHFLNGGDAVKLITDQSHGIHRILARFPHVKLSGVFAAKAENIGQLAAEMLLDKITRNKPIETMFVQKTIAPYTMRREA